MADISRCNHSFARDIEISALVSQTSCRGETIGGIAKMSAVFLGFTSQCKRNICFTRQKFHKKAVILHLPIVTFLLLDAIHCNGDKINCKQRFANTLLEPLYMNSDD